MIKRKFGIDWDEPSALNDILCSRFDFRKQNRPGGLPYRLFVPDRNNGMRYPLVIFLHGADAYGDDNVTPLEIHDIGTCFSRDEWQKKHPCYIAAPQIKAGGHWAHPVDDNNVCLMINELCSEFTDIDRERIYIYGYSAGGVGVLGLLKTHPEIFAAAVSICGATNQDNLDNLAEVPLWLAHAEDDEIVRCTYRTGDRSTQVWYGSRDINEYFHNRLANLHYTEYPTGYMKSRYGVNPHCSWVALAEDDNIKEWLFGNKKKEYH